MEGGHVDHDEVVHRAPHPLRDRKGRFIAPRLLCRRRAARPTIHAQLVTIEPGLRGGGADDIEGGGFVTGRALHDRAQPEFPPLRIDNALDRATVVQNRRRRPRFSLTGLPVIAPILSPQCRRQRAEEESQ